MMTHPEQAAVERNPMNIETCCRCNEPTGRAGAGDDSLYTAFGRGPFCQECFDEIKCHGCEGSGEIFVRRNSKGQIDYIDGSPTSETTKCLMCDGEGSRD